MKNFVIITLLSICVNLFSQENNTNPNNSITERNITITVSGSGKTQDEAKQSALRSAIEQAFGAFISAKTEILNDKIISDQITSVSSGNIQAYDILNQSQLPDGIWGVTLKAKVSIDKLTSFVEAKGVSVEIKGGLFAQNIKQQIINEQAELKSIILMIGLLHESMQLSFDYSIKSEEPKSIDSENKKWEIPLIINVKANENLEFCSNYFHQTIKALSLNETEVGTYYSLNKKTFPIAILVNGNEYTYFLRNDYSLRALRAFLSNWEFYLSLFTINSGIDEITGIKIKKMNHSSNINHTFNSYNSNIKSNLISFPNAGKIVNTFSWNDTKTLNQIEQISSYTVKPCGILSRFIDGGYAVAESKDSLLISALFDIPIEELPDNFLTNAKDACNRLKLITNKEWSIANNEQIELVYNNLYQLNIGGFSSEKRYINLKGEFVQFYKGNLDTDASVEAYPVLRAIHLYKK